MPTYATFNSTTTLFNDTTSFFNGLIGTVVKAVKICMKFGEMFKSRFRFGELTGNNSTGKTFKISEQFKTGVIKFNGF